MTVAMSACAMKSTMRCRLNKAVATTFPTSASGAYRAMWRNHQPKRRCDMAGVKGRSGGARPNSGPKPRDAVKLEIPVPVVETLAHKDAKMFLMALMNDLEADIKLRADAAKALLPFQHAKIENNVKDERAEKAKKASVGKFGAAAPPKLVVNNRG